MIRVKMLPKNEVCIIDNGKSYLFGLDGKCKQEDVGNLSSYMDGAVDLPIVSLLSSNGVVDIGVSNGDFKRYTTENDAMTCAMTLQMRSKFIKMLRRDGKQGNTSFNQLIFIYQSGSNMPEILALIGAKEV